MQTHEILCTPMEAYRLRDHLTTVAELRYAYKIIRDYSVKPTDEKNAHLFALCLADVFNAGKISGIRQERRRRAAR